MAKRRVEKLKDGTPYIAATYYEDGTELAGLWEVTLKIDGIRYIRNKMEYRVHVKGQQDYLM